MGAHLIFLIIFTLFSCIILTNQSLVRIFNVTPRWPLYLVVRDLLSRHSEAAKTIEINHYVKKHIISVFGFFLNKYLW